ncbi:MAG: hypothetical protein ICV87_13415, partial [Gemmatimonadetes bacterium]|nr:hypothetical protein [Gemmatimonadota bacterium]
WRVIPVVVVRRFMSDLFSDINLREAGRLIGRGREQVRKFISGSIEVPHPRTRQRLGELYIERHGRGDRVAETLVHTPSPTPLKLILPKGLERATAEIRALFALIRKQDDAPESAAGVEQWLIRHVKAEYSAEQSYPRPQKRARPDPDQ